MRPSPSSTPVISWAAPSMSPFANLPCELVRCIVECAADSDDLRTTLALTLVSRTVRAWVEPVLYHTVIIWTPHTLQLFRAAFAAKPPNFFAMNVRNLFVNAGDAADIIRACPRLRRLAAYPPALPEGAEAGPGLCPAPYEVSLMGVLDDVSWASPIFAATRNLYLGLEPPSPDTACDLSLLPALQRLAFPYDGDAPELLLLTVQTILESTTLRVLLVLVNDPDGHPDPDRKGSIWRSLASVEDTRLFVGTEPNYNADDWCAMVCDGTSPWDCEAELKEWRRGLL